MKKQSQFKPNSKPIVEDQYKTQDTRPKIQILSLKSGRKAGRLKKSIFCMVKKIQSKKTKITEQIAGKMLKCRQYKYNLIVFLKGRPYENNHSTRLRESI
jgi:hypothetical protein